MLQKPVEFTKPFGGNVRKHAAIFPREICSAQESIVFIESEDGMTYYARKGQLLSEHIENTANLAKKFANVFGFPNTAFTAGMLHDLGKYTHLFQDYLDRSLRGEDVTRGEVIHALQGAKFTAEWVKDPLIADIIGNIIATHHGALFDGIMDGERTLSIKTNKGEDKLHYAEAVKAFNPSINESELEEEFLYFCRTSQAKKLSPPFMLHLLTKAVYSCVVDADRCDSAGMKVSDIIPDWTKLIQLLKKSLALFPDESGIDKVRKRISEQCQDAAGRQQGVYTLSVPTGGGKTLSSLRADSLIT